MQQPGFGARVGLAISAFFKILFNGEYAAQVLQAGEDRSETLEMPSLADDTVPAQPIDVVSPTEPMPDPLTEARKALQVLGALQREGRFVDFLMEDINAATDAQIGAVARVLHGGCRKVVTDYLTIEPVWPGEEGTRVTVDEGFDHNRVSLTGNVSGEPPFHGTLQHKGWHATAVRLPELAETADPNVLAAAEIEL